MSARIAMMPPPRIFCEYELTMRRNPRYMIPCLLNTLRANIIMNNELCLFLVPTSDYIFDLVTRDTHLYSNTTLLWHFDDKASVTLLLDTQRCEAKQDSHHVYPLSPILDY